MEGKNFLDKVADGGQKFCRSRNRPNCTVSEIYIYHFVFYLEIHDGYQKMLDNNFWQKSEISCE